MHRFLLGYNIESSNWSHPGLVAAFLRAASKLHRDMSAPCTVFVRGQAIESNPEEFRRVRDECGELFDFQQYTFSCVPLKTVCQENHQGLTIFPSAPLREIRDDLTRASDAMERALGQRPIGLCGPAGYYRGLADRPELLAIIADSGIRFTRTYSRNARDWYPAAFEIQPFRYAAQGFASILEIPSQGWPDYALRSQLGRANNAAYIRRVCKDLDYVAAKDLTWSYTVSDWSAVQDDAEKQTLRAIIEHALRRGFQIMTHKALWAEQES